MTRFRIKIDLLTIIPIMVYILIFPGRETLYMIFAVIIHESGHILLSLLQGIHIRKLLITPFGLVIVRKQAISSYRQDMAVLLGGPLMNLIVFAICRMNSDFAGINLSFALLNLLPVTSLDGGRALYAFLCRYQDPEIGENLLRYTSLISLLILWILAVGELLISDAGYSLFFFSVWMFISLFIPKGGITPLE